MFSRVGWTGSFFSCGCDDLIGAIYKILQTEKSTNKIFFCSGSEVSINEVINLSSNHFKINIKWIVKLFRPVISFFPFKLKALLLPALVSSDSKLEEIGWVKKSNNNEIFKKLIEKEKSRQYFDYNGNNITIITGAASGLGRAFLNNLVKIRREIIIIDNNIKKLREIKNIYPDVEVIFGDLSKPEEIENIFNNKLKHKNITELYLCAGIGLRGKTNKLSFYSQSKIVELNLLSRLHLASLFFSTMKVNQFGRIVFVSSSSAFQPLPFMAMYSAVNSAL